MGNEDLINIEKLIGLENFHLWNFQILITLKSQDLFSIVNGNVERPTTGKDEQQKWDLKDAKAQKIIISTIERTPMLHIINSTTSKEMYAKLKSVYMRDTEEQKCQLYREFFNYSFNDDLDISLHISQLQDITVRLKTLDSNCNINEAMLINKVISALPTEYKHFVSAWESTSTSERTMDNLIARLRAEEDRLRQGKLTHTNTVAFKTTKNNNHGPRKDHTNTNHPRQLSNTNPSQLSHCKWCKKTNHPSNKCYFRKDKSKNKPNKFDKFSFVTSDSEIKTNDDTWIVDSGCSAHMTNDLQNITSFRKTINNIGTAKFSETMSATGVGTVLKKSCTLNNVLYVPELSRNLLSVNSITKNGGTVEFSDENVVIRKDENVLVGTKNRNGLFEVVLESNGHKSLLTKTEETALDWHRKMGHPSNDVLKRLIGMAKGISISTDDVNKIQDKCEVCLQSKLTRFPFNSVRTKASRPLEIIHTDICGGFEVPTWDNKKYFLGILDDYTHFAMVYLLEQKSEAEEALKHYILQAENKHNLKVYKIRLDNGGEFTSKTFKKWCFNKGVILDYTIPHSPQLNGKSERLNRSLTEKTRALLTDSELSKNMWGEALLTATYLLNRTPTTGLDKTPAELWEGRQPDLSKIKLFGTKVYAKNLGQLKKLENRSDSYVFVGYCLNGYRLWNSVKKKVIMSRDVIFIDKQPNEGYQQVNIQLEDTTFTETNESEIQIDQEENDVVTIEEEDEVLPIEPEEEITELRRSSRLRRIPTTLQDYVLLTYKEAVEGPDQQNWLKAIEDEKASLIENNTWELVDKNEVKDKKIISCRWVFKIKDDGRYKARLVARGFEQTYGIDYNETFSPVICDSSLRILFAIGKNLNYSMKKFDIKTAFLYGEIEEDIYMHVPEGFEDDNKVCKLKKSLYGLKQAPLQWNKKFTSFLKSKGLVQLKTEKCIFKTIDSTVIIGFFVDDGIIFWNNKTVSDSILENLQTEFKMSCFEKIGLFVGVHVEETPAETKLTQTKFANTVIKRFGQEDARDSSIPIETTKLLCNTPNTTFPFREAIGNLIYLSNKTRPDISFAVGFESRRLTGPTNQDVNTAKKIIKYVKATTNAGISFKNNSDLMLLEAYCDADYAGDEETRRSTTGFVIFYCGGPIAWCSRRQPIVATSTTEAEFIAAAECCKEVLHLKSVISELLGAQSSDVKTVLKVDNQSAIALIKNGILNKKRKHIDVKYHFICEKVNAREIHVEYCPSKENVSDIFTKALKVNLFQKCFSKLMAH